MEYLPFLHLPSCASWLRGLFSYEFLYRNSTVHNERERKGVHDGRENCRRTPSRGFRQRPQRSGKGRDRNQPGWTRHRLNRSTGCKDDHSFRVHQAQGVKLDPARIGEVLVAAVGHQFPKLRGKASVEVIFDSARLRELAPSVRQEKQERQRQIDPIQKQRPLLSFRTVFTLREAALPGVIWKACM